jgi:thiol-disulfide isomerase/thioredoxin
MTERFLILLVLLVLSVTGFYAWRWLATMRFRRSAGQALPATVEDDLTPGGPTVLYFTTPECSQCRFRQSPILDQLKQSLGVHILAIDAASRPEIADFFGVMTVPSTVLISEQRQPMAINHGLATLDHLQQQLLGQPMAS